jgi:hypothetical protein
MPNSNISDDDLPVNPYAVEKLIDPKQDSNFTKLPVGGFSILQALGWIFLFLISPIVGAIAFFLTCVGTFATGSIISENTVILVSGLVGLAGMIACLYFGGKFLISAYKRKD